MNELLNRKNVGLGLALGVLAYLIFKPKDVKAENATSNLLPAPEPDTKKETVGPSAPIAPTPTYTVKAGESWSNIAERVYGNYRWWPYLWDINVRTQPRFMNPDLLRTGDILEIPTGVPLKKQAAVFLRAKTHADWWRGGRVGAMPASVLVPTTYTAADFE